MKLDYSKRSEGTVWPYSRRRILTSVGDSVGERVGLNVGERVGLRVGES